MVIGHLLSLAALLGSLVHGALGAELEVLWERSYGGRLLEHLDAIVALPNGGFAAGGRNATLGGGVEDGWVLRFDESGNVLWHQTYGDTDFDWIGSLTAFPNGDLVVRGDTVPAKFVDASSLSKVSSWIVRLDAWGKISWRRDFREDNGRSVRALAILPDGGVAAVGSIFADRGPKREPWVIRLDAAGNTLWERSFPGQVAGAERKIIATDEGGYAIATTTLGDVLVRRLDLNGGLIWERKYGGFGRSSVSSIAQMSDGGFALTGDVSNPGSRSGKGGEDTWVLRTGGNGNLLWRHVFGGTDRNFGHAILALPGHGLLVGGETELEAGRRAWVMRLDSAGKLRWKQDIGGDLNFSSLRSLSSMPDGTFVGAGHTSRDGQNFDAWVVRFSVRP